MIDIADLEADWLAVYVRKTRNFTPLADWLRRGGEIGEPLRLVLADIVAGNLKPSKRRVTLAGVALPGLLRAEVEFWKSELRLHAHILCNPSNDAKTSFDWEEIERTLALAGYDGETDTAGQRTEAAKLIVSWRNRLTFSQLDELLHPRAARARQSVGG